MANKMLIDASHPEETRVVVLRGNRVEEFDFESASKKQLRGNIYLAKVTRVEPSLQAAFVDYGGNRHGFLAFSEIHPDYYQIPVVDRQALIESEASSEAEDEEEEQRRERRSRRFKRGDRNGQRADKRRGDDESVSESFEEVTAEQAQDAGDVQAPFFAPDDETVIANGIDGAVEAGPTTEGDQVETLGTPVELPFSAETATVSPAIEAPLETDSGVTEEPLDSPNVEAISDNFPPSPTDETQYPSNSDSAESEDDIIEDEADQVEQLGGDAMEEVPVRAHHFRKQYKIQEVIKRRQILLVQVVKEERGNKGAALTTYLSLAGRYSVLMPNTARGGGISRKITDAVDRQRLKSIAQELEVPEGMGVILRTAGALRTKAEVKRDFEYLLRMWETVREMTLKSTAPMLVYEEGSLIKRSIRDLFNKDIDEILVSGDEAYREAKDFMRMLMPSHVRNVLPYRDPQPIFAKSGAEAQLDAMFSNQVTLKSGGYIVINQTEALVAIDVNSGRSTREHNIEDTALRTNLEASDEIARQLRLRDLAGLIVIDFIDMEENRNNRSVERRMKDALKNDRARIQVGHISHFGLLEMSRQRIRTGVLEGSTLICPHCAGAGMVRSTASIALHVLRVLEDSMIKNPGYEFTVKTRTTVALYILNQKRANLRDLEDRFGVPVIIATDDSLVGTTYHALERGDLVADPREILNRVIEPLQIEPAEPLEIALSDEIEEEFETEAEAEGQAQDDDIGEETEASEGEGESENGRKRRRRRRRRGGRGEREGSGIAANAPQPSDDALSIFAPDFGNTLPASAPFEEHFEQIEADSDAFVPETQVSSGNDFLPQSEPPAPNLASEADVLEDAVVPEAPQKRRPRRTRVAETVDQSAATSTAVSANENEAAGEDTQPRRRPRRVPRPRTGRRGAEADANVELVQVEFALLESVESELHQAGQTQPEQIGAAESLTSTKVATNTVTDASDQAPAFAERFLDETVVRSETEAPNELHRHEDPRLGHTEAALKTEPSEAPSTTTTTPTVPSPEEAARPKRSGWWQRAKATLRG